jgi:hypothetical protein
MRKTFKFSLISLIGLCLTLVALGEWNAKINVHVDEGIDDCDYPSYVGEVECKILPNGDSDKQTWIGYGIYVFYLDAPDSGTAQGRVDLDDGNYPPQAWCVDTETDSWSSPYSSIDIYLVPETN